MSKISLQISPRLKRWWRLWKVPTVAAIILFAAWCSRGPILKLAAEWRAENASKGAQEFARDGQWMKAEAESRRALQLDRSDHDALGILMEAALRNGKPDTLRIAVAFFVHPESTASDKAKVLDLLLLSRDYIGFRRLQGLIPAEMSREPEIVLQTIRFLSVRGGQAEALAILRAYLADSGSKDERFTLLLADLFLRNADYAEAATEISTMVQKGGTVATTAFRMLEHFPIEVLRELPLVEVLLKWGGRSNLSAEEHLTLATIQFAKAKNSGIADSLVEATIMRHRDTSLELLSSWLIRIGRRGAVLGLITVEAALQSANLAALKLQSLILEKKFAESELWLSQIERVFEGSRAAATRAVIASKRNDRVAAQRYWKTALTEAGIRNEGNLYLRMALLALSFGEWDWAVETMKKASLYPETILPEGNDLAILIDYLLREDRVGEARELTGYWLAREPENPVLRNNFLYLGILSGETPDAALSQSEALCRLFPGMIGFHTTRALAQTLAGDLGAAHETISHPSLDWTRASDSDQAIRALILAKRRHPDSPVTGFFTNLQLYPAERRLFQMQSGSKGP